MQPVPSPPPAASSRFAVSSHVRSAAVDDFVVLLDRRTSRYLSLNDSGALIWSSIERGESVDEIASHLAERHAIAPGRARDDVEAMVGQLAAGELIVPEAAAASHAAPDGSADGSGDSASGDRAATSEWIRRWLAVPEASRPAGRWLSLPRGLATIARVELAMRRGGLPRLRRLLARRPRRAPTLDPRRAWQVVADAELACAFYVKKAWCLQRSVALARLLRARHVPADVVLGVVPVPFAAHAWVEVGGHVVGDTEQRTNPYLEIDRF